LVKNGFPEERVCFLKLSILTILLLLSKIVLLNANPHTRLLLCLLREKTSVLSTSPGLLKLIVFVSLEGNLYTPSPRVENQRLFSVSSIVLLTFFPAKY
jgi:hypothetical protein